MPLDNNIFVNLKFSKWVDFMLSAFNTHTNTHTHNNDDDDNQGKRKFWEVMNMSMALMVSWVYTYL